MISAVGCTDNFQYHKSVFSQLEYMPRTTLVKSLLMNLGENCSEMFDIPMGYKSWSVTNCMCLHMPVCLYMFVWEWCNLHALDACLCCLTCLAAHGTSMHSQGWTCPAGMTVCVVIWLENEKFLLYVRCNTGKDLLTRVAKLGRMVKWEWWKWEWCAF